MQYIRTGLKFDPKRNQVVGRENAGPLRVTIDPRKLKPGEREALEAGKLTPEDVKHAVVSVEAERPVEYPNGSNPPSKKYFGDVAKGYDVKRQKQDKWLIEQGIIEGMLDEYPKGTKVVDAPVGTGRFFQKYHDNRFIVKGVDISADMLTEASIKIPDNTAIIDGEAQWSWAIRNIIEEGLGLDDNSVDVALSIRFTRWVQGQYGEEGIAKLLAELQRVATKAIILTARVKEHPNMVPIETIEKYLDGWKIQDNVRGYEDAYRIIRLVPA